MTDLICSMACTHRTKRPLRKWRKKDGSPCCGRTPDVETPFCAWCGSPMTDEAVDVMLERWKEAVDGEAD